MSGISLIFTFVCILFLYLPMMYIGYSPFLAATLVVILTTLVSMYFIGGFSVKTACSVLGTIAGVIVAGVIAMIFGNLSHISGWNVSEIETMIVIGQNSKLQIGGMMFSGILIASLGAVMDVSMSVASTINEIYIDVYKRQALFHHKPGGLPGIQKPRLSLQELSLIHI